jgi:hypothetical protein
MRLISPLLIGALVALASSAHAQPDPATAQGGLRGFLFTSDGRPVAGAAVTAEGADTTETGPEGMFYLRLSAGAHVLILRAAGRPALRTSPLPVLEGQDTELMVVYRDGGEPEVDVEAPDEARAADTSSQAVALGRVSGVVLDEAKRGPVEGARVFVRGARVEARTDARGRFELMLPLGEQELTIIHPGFATATLRVEGVAEREGLAEAEGAPQEPSHRGGGAGRHDPAPGGRRGLRAGGAQGVQQRGGGAGRGPDQQGRRLRPPPPPWAGSPG